MTAAIVVAAGAGTRLGGDVPKAFRKLGGKPLVSYSLTALNRCPQVNRIVLVAPASHVEQARGILAGEALGIDDSVVAGGDHRHQSVLAGLRAVPEETEWALVHDAARPFATTALFADVIESAKAHSGAIAARRATDTLKREDDGRVIETLSRAGIWMAETPQVFRRSELIEALEEAMRKDMVPTDEAQAMEWSGARAVLVESKGVNIKITTPADWAYAECLIRTWSE